MRFVLKHVFVLCAASLAFCPVVAAQASESGQILAETGNATFDRAVSASRNGIEISTANASSRVSLTTGQDFSTGGGNGTGANFLGWSLTASAPLEKSEDLTDLATLDGLANAFTLEFKLTQYEAPGVRIPNNTALLDEIGDQAEAVFKSVGPRGNCPKFVRDFNCVQEYVPQRYAEFKSLFWDPKQPKWIRGVKAKVGYETFDFFDPVSFSENDDTKTPWSVGAFYGVIPSGSRTLYAISYEHQTSYKASTSQTMCMAADPTTMVQSCQTGAFAEPSEETKKLLSFEARRRIENPLFGQSPAAFSAGVTYDFESETLGVDVPVYLFSSEKEALNGGIRFGWRDDDDDLIVGLFVGSTFEIFD